MNTHTNKHNMPYAPTDTADLYPDTDGQPMADTDLHLYWLKRVQDIIETHFSRDPGVYISGNIMMYDIEGPMRYGYLARYSCLFRDRTEVPPYL